jgi:hypothetical protein
MLTCFYFTFHSDLQVFSEYQMQQMAPQFIENYGFHDDEFTDGEDALQYVYATCLFHSKVCI